MKAIQLTRHSDNKLYSGIAEVAIEEDYGSLLICLSPFSPRELEGAIQYRASLKGANAYEFCGGKLMDWSGEYCGSYSFYKIDKANLKLRGNGQLELSFSA